jgi:hypothetical protein
MTSTDAPTPGSQGIEYPGSAQHCPVVRAIVEQYAGDLRILAATVFGSSGHGDWQQAEPGCRLDARVHRHRDGRVARSRMGEWHPAVGDHGQVELGGSEQ